MIVRHSGLLGSGRIPGSLGMHQVLGFHSAPVSQATETIFEPEPVSSWNAELQMTDFAGEPIAFIPPTVGEVRQGQTGNCPVVATLAALAHAAPNRIVPMISTRGATVSAKIIDTRETTPTHRTHVEKTILYKVRFARGDPAEVSGLLWNRNGALEYASSTQGALWPSIFEKAYVVAHGGNSYNTIFATVTPHEAMTNMLGPVDELVLKKSPKTLRDVLRRADKRPTIADTLSPLPSVPGTPPGIIGFHTYAVLDLRGENVAVFNVQDGATISVPLGIFKQVFETVVQLRM